MRARALLQALRHAGDPRLVPSLQLLLASRRPELVADAAHAVVTRPSRDCTGNLFLAEDVLAEDGITDMAAYSYGEQKTEPIPDLFVDQG